MNRTPQFTDIVKMMNTKIDQLPRQMLRIPYNSPLYAFKPPVLQDSDSRSASRRHAGIRDRCHGDDAAGTGVTHLRLSAL